MANRWKNDLTGDDVTPQPIYMNRRQIMAGLAGMGLAGAAGAARAETLEPNSWEDITSYNNFYEFGTGKDDPARYAKITIEPRVPQPATIRLKTNL